LGWFLSQNLHFDQFNVEFEPQIAHAVLLTALQKMLCCSKFSGFIPVKICITGTISNCLLKIYFLSCAKHCEPNVHNASRK